MSDALGAWTLRYGICHELDPANEIVSLGCGSPCGTMRGSANRADERKKTRAASHPDSLKLLDFIGAFQSFSSLRPPTPGGSKAPLLQIIRR